MQRCKAGHAEQDSSLCVCASETKNFKTAHYKLYSVQARNHRLSSFKYREGLIHLKIGSARQIVEGINGIAYIEYLGNLILTGE